MASSYATVSSKVKTTSVRLPEAVIRHYEAWCQLLQSSMRHIPNRQKALQVLQPHVGLTALLRGLGTFIVRF